MDHEPDVRGVTPVLRADDLLGEVVQEVGPISTAPARSFFRRFVRSIVRQQVSMASATAIEGRLESAVDLTPAAVVSADPDRLRSAGLSEQKTRSVLAVAEQFHDGTWSREAFADRSDEEVIEELTQVHGIGVWTAKMQLMFSLGRPDVFPVEDLGIRNGMTALVGEELTRAEMVEVSQRWAPRRSLAARYLWHLVD